MNSSFKKDSVGMWCEGFDYRKQTAAIFLWMLIRVMKLIIAMTEEYFVEYHRKF